MIALAECALERTIRKKALNAEDLARAAGMFVDRTFLNDHQKITKIEFMLPPIGNTFVDYYLEEDEARPLARSRSFSGYVPHHITAKREAAHLNAVCWAEGQKELLRRPFECDADFRVVRNRDVIALPPCSAITLASTLVSSSGLGLCSDADGRVEPAAADTFRGSRLASHLACACDTWSMTDRNSSLCLDDDDLDTKMECRMTSPMWADTDEDDNSCGMAIGTVVSDSLPTNDQVSEHDVDHPPLIGSQPVGVGSASSLANLMQLKSPHGSRPTEAVPPDVTPPMSLPNSSVQATAAQTTNVSQCGKHREDARKSVRDAMIARASAAAAAALQNLSAKEVRHKSRAVGKQPPRTNASGRTAKTPEVPGEVALVPPVVASQREAAVQSYTTLMIRNLPSAITQQQLLEEMNASGFAGLYDFCYMPGGAFKASKMNGFAFANFISHESAVNFANVWHESYRFDMRPVGPALSIWPATVQGKHANLVNYESCRTRSSRNPKFQPFVLEAQTAPMC